MLKKLRIKFIAIIMASVAVVLVVAFVGICMNERRSEMADVQEAMSTAIDQVVADKGVNFEFGIVIGTEAPQSIGGMIDGKGRRGGSGDESSDSRAQGLRIGGGGGSRDTRELMPVAVYEITQTSDSAVLTIVSSFATAQISDDALAQASSYVQSAADGQGTLNDLGLHYLKRTTDWATYVAFTDTGSTTGWRSLAIALGIAAIIVLLAFFVISLWLSKWALRPVEEAWAAQRQFVADASHELKTPLTVVLANTSILLKHAEDSIASQSQWIESTQIEAENMQGLVNEMLELAQVESRKNVQHEPFDLSDLVDGLVLQFESVAFERGCELEEDVAPDVTVSGDVQRLRKMISTLVENALKYVDEQGRVRVTLKQEGKQAKLVVSNSGSTISAEDLPHVFDRFYRTDKARTSGEGGYGLGLAIAREIAREHDGDIACASDATVGTSFVVSLPTA